MSPGPCSPLPATNTRLPYVTHPEKSGGLLPGAWLSVDVAFFHAPSGVWAWATLNNPATAAAIVATNDPITDRRDALSLTSILTRSWAERIAVRTVGGQGGESLGTWQGQGTRHKGQGTRDKAQGTPRT